MLASGVCNWCNEHKDEQQGRPYLYGIRLCTDCLSENAPNWRGMPDMARAVLIKNGEIEP